MTSLSDFSYANEIAGHMSVPKSMHKMQINPTGNGIPNTINARKGVISGTLLARV